MKTGQIILGVDVSKSTLDIHCWQGQRHIHIQNSPTGFRDLEKWCRGLGYPLSECMVVMEHTGGYEHRLIRYCEEKEIDHCRISGLAIKRSLGIKRGKNDKVDAKRIANYAQEKHQLIEPDGPLNPVIASLKELLSLRKRLVRERAGYKSSISERKHMYDVAKGDLMLSIYQKKVKENDSLIKKVEKNIQEVIGSDPCLKTNYQIITSIQGIGMVNAAMTIAYTENFSSFTNPRSYAVYVGVVPFDNSSGKFVGRKKVSHLANKELKQELSQAAKTAAQWDKDIRDYAERKLKDKPYGLVMNNVKFKLILRMFSLVKRQEKNVENYNYAA